MPLFHETEEGKLLDARLQDAVYLADKRNTPQFTNFLDERESNYVRDRLKNNRSVEISFWGGFDKSERVCAGIFPYGQDSCADEFDISAITARYRKDTSLTHRDFLGTLMSLGLKREVIGDILVEEGRCVFFVKRDIEQYITEQLFKVGGEGVLLSVGFEHPLPEGARFDNISATVASGRLDCVVKALTNTGRDSAAALIKSGRVTLNFVEEYSNSASVSDGAKISIRGYGKYIIDQIGPKTRKGRLSLKARKYI